MSERDVLVVGNLRGASRSALTTALRGQSLSVTELSDVEQAISSLESKLWTAILVDTTLSGASKFCGEARANLKLLEVPLIALTPRLTDLAFLNALRWGADDVVALGAAEPLAVRIAALLARPRGDSASNKGQAVVADSDPRRCGAVGRALHSAGYRVGEATDKVSARFYVSKPGVSLFVLNAELTDPRPLIEEARRNGCDCRWVILARPQQTKELEHQLGAMRGVVVLTSSGPPENVLFAVNLLFPSEASRRGEVRALFGTVVFFRSVGEYRDECGFSYTASPQGLYIRTLAPAPTDKVWVELIPPDGERRVRLVGKVAWSRRFGSLTDEAAPPGFGIQIVDGLGEDLAVWSECLSQLEFRAPATLVPEARFSSPSYKVPVPAAAQAAAESRNSVSVPRPPLSSRRNATINGPPRVRISTRPPLRLSVPSPNPLSHSFAPKQGPMLSTASDQSTRAGLPPASRRAGAGKTTIGLGLLRRDGSVSQDEQPKATDHGAAQLATPVAPAPAAARAVIPKPADPAADPFSSAASSFPPPLRSGAPTEQLAPSSTLATPAQSEGSRRAASPAVDSVPPVAEPSADDTVEQPAAELPDAVRLSPITGRTLAYGSDAPPQRLSAPPSLDMPQADAKLSPSPSLAEYAGFAQVEGDLDSDRADDISERPTLADHNAVNLESLPPGVLESDAPSMVVDTNKGLGPPPAPVRRFNAGVDSVLTETDRNWVGLDAPNATTVPPTDSPTAGRFAGTAAEPSAAEPSAAEPSVPGTQQPPEPEIDRAPGVEPYVSAARQWGRGEPEPTASGVEKLDATKPGALAARGGLPASGPAVGGPATLDCPEPPSEDTDSARTPTESKVFIQPDSSVLTDTQPIAIAGLRARRRPWAAVIATLSLAAAVVVGVQLNSRSKSQPDPKSSVARATAAVTSTASDSAPKQPVDQTGMAISMPTDLVEPSDQPQTSGTVSAGPSSAVLTAASVGAARDTPVAEHRPAAAPSLMGSPAPAPPSDPQALSSKTGMLYVRSATDARVFLHGVESGPTNTWLVTPCGTRFLRLGSRPGAWISSGFATVIRCREANTVEVSEE